jgi:hypothetical protein
MLSNTVTNDEKRAKELAKRILLAETFAGIFERGIQRHNRSGDPVMRATLLFDKLYLLADVLSSVISTGITDDEDPFPIELRNRIANCSKLLNTELDFILDWISHPIYNPDHPYGNHIMRHANNHFNSVAVPVQAKAINKPDQSDNEEKSTETQM